MDRLGRERTRQLNEVRMNEYWNPKRRQIEIDKRKEETLVDKITDLYLIFEKSNAWKESVCVCVWGAGREGDAHDFSDTSKTTSVAGRERRRKQASIITIILQRVVRSGEAEETRCTQCLKEGYSRGGENIYRAIFEGREWLLLNRSCVFTPMQY